MAIVEANRAALEELRRNAEPPHPSTAEEDVEPA
jgi:hypothetical protein